MFAKVLVVVLIFTAIVEGKEEDQERTPRIDLGDMAKELLARSGTSSQVLSLNLTNLVILLVLKGLLFGVTMYGNGGHGGNGGAGGHGYKHRSLETQDLISESEVMLITSYLMGDTDKDYSCLYRIACQEPKKSKQYLQAAKILLKGSQIFSDLIQYDNKYESLVNDMQEAIEFGSKYGTCEQKYSCKTQNNV